MKYFLIYICVTITLSSIFSSDLLGRIHKLQKLENLGNFEHVPTEQDLILDNVIDSLSVEKLFKVFCTVYKKDISLENEEGKRKLNIFKQKLQEIKKFNEDHKGIAKFGLYASMIDDIDQVYLNKKEENFNLNFKNYGNKENFQQEEIKHKISGKNSLIQGFESYSEDNEDTEIIKSKLKGRFLQGKKFDFDQLADEDDSEDSNFIENKKDNRDNVDFKALEPLDYRQYIPYNFTKNLWYWTEIGVINNFIESYEYMRNKKYVSLSNKQFYFCYLALSRGQGLDIKYYGSSIHEIGMFSDEAYGSSRPDWGNKTCWENNINSSRYTIDTYAQNTDTYGNNINLNYESNSNEIYNRLLDGPVHAYVLMSDTLISSYKSGIVSSDKKCEGRCWNDKWTCNPREQVLIVGYGFDQNLNTAYWIVTIGLDHTHGEKGYMRIKRDDDLRNFALGCVTKTLPKF